VNTRLAPDLVYPVRGSDLREALGEATNHLELVWLFWVKQPTVTPVRASWAPLVNVMADRPEPHHRLKVWIYPISKQDHQRVRSVIAADALPDLGRWCRAALAAPEGWKLMRHERRWSLDGNTATAQEREGVAALHS
jgi:hypothetical protein